jgi:hypothetical protein
VAANLGVYGLSTTRAITAQARFKIRTRSIALMTSMQRVRRHHRARLPTTPNRDILWLPASVHAGFAVRRDRRRHQGSVPDFGERFEVAVG